VVEVRHEHERNPALWFKFRRYKIPVGWLEVSMETSSAAPASTGSRSFNDGQNCLLVDRLPLGLVNLLLSPTNLGGNGSLHAYTE
jgi:hypothetical protein